MARHVRLGVALRHGALAGVQTRRHALLHVLAQLLDGGGVFVVGEPHLDTDAVGLARAGKLVDETEACRVS